MTELALGAIAVFAFFFSLHWIGVFAQNYLGYGTPNDDDTMGSGAALLIVVAFCVGVCYCVGRIIMEAI